MTPDPAILDWLNTRFEALTRTRKNRDREYRPASWPGPHVLRPLFSLRPGTDTGKPMHVAARDYDDPMRWWL